MRKKLLSILALLCLTVSSAWAAVVANGNCGTTGHETEVTWSLDDAGVLTISGSGAMADYSNLTPAVPWNGNKNSITSIVVAEGVTYIGNYAFLQCRYATSISLPTTLTSIGDYAFSRCDNPSLTSITIPENVQTIGIYAFSNCTKATSISLPTNLTSIGNYAFATCSSLTSVDIPNKVTTIGNNAFYNCSNLGTVNIGSGVETIGENAFKSCSKLGTVTIGNSVVTIGNGAFHTCSILSSVDIPNSVTSIGNFAFQNCSKLGTVNIGSAVTTIGNNAFNGCSSLTSISIPASVTSIDYNVFYNCSSLASVTLNSNPYIGSNVFYGIKSDATVTMNLTANPAGGANWLTFYNKLYNFEADANTQVFKAELSGTTITMHEVTDKIVDAGTAVVLKSTGDPVMTLTTEASTNANANSLEGVSDAAGKTSDGTTFVLNNGTQGVGFYRLATGKTLGVGKAYLTYSGSLSSRGFIGFDDTTGFGLPTAAESSDADAAVYDLQGRRVAQPKKGLYIINGKKVLYK